MRATIIAIIVAGFVLYVLSRTEVGAKLFFAVKGSVPATTTTGS